MGLLCVFNEEVSQHFLTQEDKVSQDFFRANLQAGLHTKFFALDLSDPCLLLSWGCVTLVNKFFLIFSTDVGAAVHSLLSGLSP